MASGPEWDELEESVTAIADDLGVDVDELLSWICRYRNLIRVLLSLCEV